MKEASWDQICHFANVLAKKNADIFQWLTENWDLIKILMAVTEPKQINREKLRAFLAECIKSASHLLKCLKTVELAATKGFKVNEHIRDGKVVDGVKWWLGQNFIEIFGSSIMPPQPIGNVHVYQLIGDANDRQIIAELGGEEVVETTLTQMWQMLTKQGHGEEGDLLINGYANIFYIKDAKGDLWAVICYWNSGVGDWRIGANPVTDPCRCRAGSQVVSP